MDVSPEPTPSWYESLGQWGAYWDIHVYFFGISFSICGLWNLCSLILLLDEKRRRTSKKTFKCFLTSNILLAYFNIIRGCCLLLDPYNSNVHYLFIPSGASFLVWGLTVPCFTSTFMLVNFMLLEVSKIQVYSKRLQSLQPIILVVVFNFLFGLSVDLVTIYMPHLYWLLYVCQFVFLFMGLAIAVSMMYSGYRVITTVRRSRKKVLSFGKVSINEGKQGRDTLQSETRINTSELGRNGDHIQMAEPNASSNAKGSAVKFENNESFEYTDHDLETNNTKASKDYLREEKKREKHQGTRQYAIGIGHAAAKGSKGNTAPARGKIMKLTMIVLIISVCASLYSVAQLYSLLAVYKLSDSNHSIDSWNWFAYQTTARLLEGGISSCMSYIVRANIPCGI